MARRRDLDPRMRLFCFPHAGGNAGAYRDWPRGLPRGIEVCPIDLPGRGARWAERPYRAWEPLVRDVARALQGWLDRPFVFFGHSLGSLIAFEVARELRRGGRPLPRHLYASARRAPQFLADSEPLHELDDARLVDLVCRRHGAIPPHIPAQPEVLRPLLPALRADLEIHASYRYRPEPPLACAVSALGGANDPLATAEQLWAWREQAAGPFALRMFNGGHFYLQAHERNVLSVMAGDLEETATAA
jgi:medium-chain acyl-[acyl-carrier-protein] hydrolase